MISWSTISSKICQDIHFTDIYEIFYINFLYYRFVVSPLCFLINLIYLYIFFYIFYFVLVFNGFAHHLKLLLLPNNCTENFFFCLGNFYTLSAPLLVTTLVSLERVKMCLIEYNLLERTVNSIVTSWIPETIEAYSSNKYQYL